jgi:hypothetical protein
MVLNFQIQMYESILIDLVMTSAILVLSFEVADSLTFLIFYLWIMNLLMSYIISLRES